MGVLRIQFVPDPCIFSVNYLRGSSSPHWKEWDEGGDWKRSRERGAGLGLIGVYSQDSEVRTGSVCVFLLWCWGAQVQAEGRVGQAGVCVSFQADMTEGEGSGGLVVVWWWSLGSTGMGGSNHVTVTDSRPMWRMKVYWRF